MSKEPKYKLFMRTFELWRVHMVLPYCRLVKDNRINSRAELVSWDDGTFTLRINAHRVGMLCKGRVMLDALHELGHLLYDLDYDTEEEQIASEFQADLFAVRMMRHHYPIEYKEACADMHERIYGNRENSWKRKHPNHLKAFKQIKDYKNGSNRKKKGSKR